MDNYRRNAIHTQKKNHQPINEVLNAEEHDFFSLSCSLFKLIQFNFVRSNWFWATEKKSFIFIARNISGLSAEIFYFFLVSSVCCRDFRTHGKVLSFFSMKNSEWFVSKIGEWFVWNNEKNRDFRGIWLISRKYYLSRCVEDNVSKQFRSLSINTGFVLILRQLYLLFTLLKIAENFLTEVKNSKCRQKNNIFFPSLNSLYITWAAKCFFFLLWWGLFSSITNSSLLKLCK